MENKIRQERKVKQIKAIGKAFVVAFSIYSKIPMPRFNWESDDMKYHLCFFPWVGAVIGGAAWLWSFLCMQRELGCEAFVFLGLAIPILITGGFHLDGFMDTCDALHSYQDREKKLEILKDPHIGAFAVICLAAYLLMAAGSLSIVASLGSEGLLPWEAGRVMGVLCMGFFLSRALSGISVVTMQGAKKKGMLQTFSDTAGKKTVLIILLIQMILCAAGMIWLCPACGLAALLGAGLSYLYYFRMSGKQFGGITGDLAGYFVSVAELVMLMAVTLLCVIMA